MTIDQGVRDWSEWLTKNRRPSVSSVWTTLGLAFLRTVTGTLLVNIETEQITKWVNSSGKLATRKNRMAVVRNLFKYLHDRDVISPNPAKFSSIDYLGMSHDLKETKKTRGFTMGEFTVLMQYLDRRKVEMDEQIFKAEFEKHIQKLNARRQVLMFWKSAATISLCTGLRMADIATLEVVSLGPPLVVWTRKRNKRVEPHILYPERYEQALEIVDGRSPYAFPIQREVYINARKRLVKQFTQWCKDCWFKGLHFHSLRYSYSQECKKLGIPTPHIQAWMGHATIEQTNFYINGGA